MDEDTKLFPRPKDKFGTEIWVGDEVQVASNAAVKIDKNIHWAEPGDRGEIMAIDGILPGYVYVEFYSFGKYNFLAKSHDTECLIKIDKIPNRFEEISKEL